MSIEIAIPYWGDADLLREAVDSVRAQTDPDWTLLVVDDCYPDRWAGPWLAGLDDPRIRYVRNEGNLGIIANFQRCLDLATGERVTFLGCDDALLPGYVATIRDVAARHPDVELIQPGVAVVDEEGRPFLPLSDRVKAWLRGTSRTSRLERGERVAASLLIGDWLYWPSLSFRTQALRGRQFRTDLPILLDLALVLDLLVSGGAVAVDDRVGFRYRRHRTSLSSAALLDGTRFADERRFFLETARRLRAHGWPRAARAARWHPTSRLYAVSLLPQAITAREWASVRALVRHAFSP